MMWMLLLLLWCGTCLLFLFFDDGFGMSEFPLVWQHFQEFILRSLGLVGHIGDDAVQVEAWAHLMRLAGCQKGAYKVTSYF